MNCRIDRLNNGSRGMFINTEKQQRIVLSQNNFVFKVLSHTLFVTIQPG